MGMLAIVFSGQGAQEVGMGSDLYQSDEKVREIFDFAGEKIKKLCFSGPVEQLNQTINTQPCLFTLNLAIALSLKEKNIIADGVAGFSLGEVSAAVYSGVLDLKSGFEFVNYRAAIMQECAEENKGVMFAVLKLPTEKVISLCNEFNGVYPVNFNCEGQTVTACSAEVAQSFQVLCENYGARVIKLAVSGAFHSPYMDEAAKKLSKFLCKIELNIPKIPMYSNKSAQIYDNPKALLAQQVNHPVLWQKTIENMICDGYDTFIEVGAGKTLSGLLKKIGPTLKIYTANNLETLKSVENELNGR